MHWPQHRIASPNQYPLIGHSQENISRRACCDLEMKCETSPNYVEVGRTSRTTERTRLTRLDDFYAHKRARRMGGRARGQSASGDIRGPEHVVQGWRAGAARMGPVGRGGGWPESRSAVSAGDRASEATGAGGREARRLTYALPAGDASDVRGRLGLVTLQRARAGEGMVAVGIRGA